MSKVHLKNIKKSFGAVDVIKGVDLEIADGEFCVFVGPSGCGKSTLLRMISGLETITAGDLSIGDRRVNDLEPSKRGISMVFQTYALYPHMTVRENMGFALKYAGDPKEEIAAKVAQASRILGLDPLLDRKPKALSGGQRQRVAIGRSIVRHPEVFLFVEPLSNLDAELRVHMRVEILCLHKDLGATMIYVTHDQVEAMTLADKIVVLRGGYIEQVGSPLELYCNAANKFVGGFIGSPAMNFMSGKVVSGRVAVDGLKESISVNASNLSEVRAVEVGIRPEHIHIDPSGDVLRLDVIEKLGATSYAYLESTTGERLIVGEAGISTLKEDDLVGISFDPTDALVFDKETGQRIY